MSRRYSSSASPLEDEDLLQEILLRLPPMPSSLPRASLVCKSWRSILSDTRFLSRFRKHHRVPPLLGFFQGKPSWRNYIFTSILEPPDRVPAARFMVPLSLSMHWGFMGCPQGLIVMFKESSCETVVCDPLTGQQHRVASPPVMNLDDGECWDTATVLCADAEDGHVHGDCFSSPFKLVLICEGYLRAFLCLYDSVSGVWGDVVSTTTTTICQNLFLRPGILAGNALCWGIGGGHILAFDLETQSLGVIEKPTDAHVTGDVLEVSCFQPLRMENGGLGLAVLSEFTVQLWARSICDGVVGWVLQKTILLEGLLPQEVHSHDGPAHFVGYDEDANMVVLSTMIGNFTLQLDSMLIRHIIRRNEMCYNSFYPYRNFYTAGRRVEWNWLDLKTEL
ncbi:uncharacterized protein [Lolium perenne]|uniref:uncharacterized protein n=1 Tax=Lolium perenne TaxID=4522 RepID=UPI0021F59E5D|nr:uncharacterized protein LOC127291830 [Lolium perenne]